MDLHIGIRVRVLSIPGESELTERDCPYETEIVDQLVGGWWAVPQKDSYRNRWGVMPEDVEILDHD